MQQIGGKILCGWIPIGRIRDKDAEFVGVDSRFVGGFPWFLAEFCGLG